MKLAPIANSYVIKSAIGLFAASTQVVVIGPTGSSVTTKFVRISEPSLLMTYSHVTV